MAFVVQIDLVQYMGLDSLVWCELISFCFFIDESANWFGTVHVRLVRKLQPAPCYPEIFKILLCLVVLQKLLHLNPRRASQNYNARENSHLLWNPDMRNARDTPGLKEPPSTNQWGTSVTYPTFRTSGSLSHGSPLPSHQPTHSYTKAAKTREAPHPPPSAT